eukprot:9115266-Lingulodinium_polyedra.AAC.1
MRSYFQQRRSRIPGARPRWGTMLALVLEPKGSAPGTDGLPYEVYQQAPATLACILGQAVHYAHLGPGVICNI